MKLTINTAPVPKGRPRFTRSGHVYTAKRTRDFEKLVGWNYRANGGPRFRAGVFVKVDFFVSRDSDLDNLQKSFLDGLNGVAWTDDRQVVRVHATKTKSPDARIEAEITEWPPA